MPKLKLTYFDIHGGRGEHYVELGDVARTAPLLVRAMLGVSALGLVAGCLRLLAAGGGSTARWPRR